MAIRKLGLEWLSVNVGKPAGRVHVSRYYTDDKSWCKQSVWWFEIPLAAVDDDCDIHFLCQKTPGGDDFFYLRVPPQFLKQNQHRLFVRPDNGRLSMYFGTERPDLFVELRGNGRVPFSQFVRPPK